MVTNDPTVRAIRVANALNERFGAIMLNREKSYGIDQEQIEIEASEAEQIHPEIWSLLDEARNALGQRGLVVTEYDTIRAAERGTQWRINLAGFKKAEQACRVLMGLLPEVDWAELDRADAAEIAAAGSLRGSGVGHVATKIALGIGGLVALTLMVILIVLFKTRNM